MRRTDVSRAGFTGPVHLPRDPGYDAARGAWNRTVDQRPALVVEAAGAGDVVAAVRLAGAQHLGVAVLATGHGVAAPADGGVLVTTGRMRGVRVDPRARTARVEAGARWADLLPAAAPHGLAGLQGSSSDVGIVGYTTGGGMGWLARRYGLAADHVTAAEVVTADGELRRVHADMHSDLFWGLRGGTGNLGIVTALEFSLVPVTHVYGGSLAYPVERAAEVLELFDRWSARLPDEVTAGVALLNPPGRSVAVVRFCYTGPDLRGTGEELLRPWRAQLGEPVADTVAVLPYAALDTISSDPVEPTRATGHVELLDDLPDAAVLVKVASAEAGSPLVEVELRLLGGALARRPAERPSPIGAADARYILYALGTTPTPEAAVAVRDGLADVAEAVRPHATGATYVNFLGLGATPERTRAAYPPADLRRLVELKRRWDPANLFRFNRNLTAK
jgi:FAD/FMN-containing dehydrogenase